MLLRHGRCAAFLALVLLAGCAAEKYDRIKGDTPNEVAVSVSLIAGELDPDKQAAFNSAVDLLRMTATDRYGSRFASVTPQMALQLRGRTAEDVIQMATVYRSAIPVYPSNKDLARYRPRDR
jgi:hypothetical protein